MNKLYKKTLPEKSGSATLNTNLPKGENSITTLYFVQG
jgi:hypothetical protein